MSQKNSPFKFLDSYEKEDVKVFFGRDQETQDLYDALSGVKHLLVYGPSGSGKSSLVECGLRNQFSDADWFALTIRKGHDINASVFNAINEALHDKIVLDSKTKLPVDPEIGFGEAIEKLFEERYQPVYLLFDQFEELLITGEKQEKIDFFTNLNTLIRNRLPSRVLLIMREEFIGHFSEFESLCPSIFQHRFRVEKMGRKQVQEVIQAMLDAPLYRDYFDVKDSQKLAESILSKLPDKRKEIELSHVQVFLGELWDRASIKGTGNELPIFSTDLIKRRDNLESVLESFLIKQIKELEKTYGKRVPIELLAVMISERFTKLQLSEADILVALKAKEVNCDRPLIELLQDLQTRRIIRAIKVGDESQYEISHDTLALVVGQNKTENMKIREKAENVYRTYEERSGLFSQVDIDYLRSFERSLKYPPELDKRIKKSIATLENNRNAELAKTNKRLFTYRSLLVVAVLALIVGWYYWNSAEELTIKSQSQTVASLSGEQLDKDPTLAIRLAELAWQKYPSSPRTLTYQKRVLNGFYGSMEEKKLFYTNKLTFEQPVNNVIYSPNGKTILTTLEDVTPRLWNSETGKLIVDLKGHEKPVNSAVFSPDGKIIVTASSDKTARLWNMDGKLLAILKGHDDNVNSAVFSRDGTKIVTASDDKTAKLWNMETGKCLATLEEHSQAVNSAALNQDGTKIVTASSDNTAKLWNVETEKLLATLKGHEDHIFSAVFSQDGTKIVTASSDKTAKLWNLEGTVLTTLEGHAQPVNSAVFSPDGKSIVTSSDDTTARLWDVKTGSHLATLEGHEQAVNSAVFSMDGKTIVTASSDHTVRLWNVETWKYQRQLKGHEAPMMSAVFSPDGQSIVTASSDSTAILWNAKNGKSLAHLKAHTKAVNKAIFSPDGKTILTASIDKMAILWDAKTGKHLATLEGHDANVASAVFSPDMKYIVTASWDKYAMLWDAKTGKHLATLEGHDKPVTSAVFSPNGKTIVTASWDDKPKLWDVETRNLIATLKGHKQAVNSAVFSPDGKQIVTASEDHMAKLWNAQNGEFLGNLKGHTKIVLSAEFSPDGKTIVTASDDETAKLWNAENGKLLATLKGHKQAVNSAVFSTDGKIIVTASDDKTVKLWNAESGKPLANLIGHKGFVISANFSPDGKNIVSAAFDNMAKLWFTPEGIIDWLSSQKDIYQLTKQDREYLGVDFIEQED